MNDLIEDRLRAAAHGLPVVLPPLSELRKKAGRRRAAVGATVVAALGAVAVVAVVVPRVQPVDEGRSAATSASQGGLRIDVKTRDASIALGERLEVMATVTNTTSSPMTLTVDDCVPDPLTVLVFVPRAGEGQALKGNAKAFKARILDSEIGQFLPREDLTVRDDRTCAFTSVVLGPGATRDVVGVWRADLPEGGRSDGRATISVMVNPGPPDEPQSLDNAFEVQLPVRLVGDSGQPGVSDVLDAALTEPDVAAWIDRQTFAEPCFCSATLVRADRWEVSIEASGSQGSTAGVVVVDAVSGEVISSYLPAPPPAG